MLQTSLNEKLMLRKTVSALEEEIARLRGSSAAAASSASAHSRLEVGDLSRSTRRGIESASVHGHGGRSVTWGDHPSTAVAGPHSEHRMASSQAPSPWSGSNVNGSMHASNNAAAGGGLAQSLGIASPGRASTASAGPNASFGASSGGLKVSVRQFKRLKYLLFRSIVYAQIVSMLKFAFRKWYRKVTSLRRAESGPMRHIAVTRLLETNAQQLQSLMFLKWKAALSSLQRVETRTYRAIKKHLKRKLACRVWMRWRAKFTQRRRMQQLLTSRVVVYRRSYRLMALRQWRCNVLMLNTSTALRRTRHRCGIRLLQSVLGRAVGDMVRKAWKTLKHTSKYETRVHEVRWHALRSALNLLSRQASCVAIAFARWRKWSAADLKDECRRFRLLTIVTRKDHRYTRAAVGAISRRFHCWKHAVREIRHSLERGQLQQEVASLKQALQRTATMAQAEIKKAIYAARQAETEMQRMEAKPQKIPAYMKRSMRKVLAKFGRNTKPTAFYWWVQVTASEREREERFLRGLKLVRNNFFARFEKTVTRCFAQWVCACQELKKEAITAQFNQAEAMLSTAREQINAQNQKQLDTEQSLLQQQAENLQSLQSSKERFEKVVSLLIKLIFRKVFLGKLNKAFTRWHRTASIISERVATQREMEAAHFLSTVQMRTKRLIQMRLRYVKTYISERMAVAFSRWSNIYASSVRRQRLAKRAISRLLYQRVSEAFLRWKEEIALNRLAEHHAAESGKAFLKKFIQKWFLRLYGDAFEKWKSVLVNQNVEQKLLGKVFYYSRAAKLRVYFGKFKRIVFFDYACLLETQLANATSELRIAHSEIHRSSRHMKTRLVFTHWKQYTHWRCHVVLNRSADLVTARLQQSVSVKYFRILKLMRSRRRILRRICTRKIYTSLLKAITLWKNVFILQLRNSEDSALGSLQSKLASTRKTAATLAEDNMTLVNKLTDGAAILKRHLAKVGSLVAKVRKIRRMRSVMQHWVLLRRIRSDRRNGFVTTIKLTMSQVSSGRASMRLSLEHWRVAALMKRFRRHSNRKLMRGCFNGWKMHHFYYKLQRSLASKLKHSDIISKQYRCFCAWKHGVWLQKSNSALITRIMSSNKNLGDVLHKAKRRAARECMDLWKEFVADRKSAAKCVEICKKGLKGRLLNRWKMYTRKRNKVRRMSRIIVSHAQNAVNWRFYTRLSRAWRRWHTFLSLSVRSTIVGTWQRCRTQQKQVAVGAFSRLLYKLHLSKIRRLMMLFWQRWRVVVRKETALVSLVGLSKCFSVGNSPMVFFCPDVASRGGTMAARRVPRRLLNANDDNSSRYNSLVLALSRFPNRVSRAITATIMLNSLLRWRLVTTKDVTVGLRDGSKNQGARRLLGAIRRRLLGRLYQKWKSYYVSMRNREAIEDQLRQHSIELLEVFNRDSELYAIAVQQRLLDIVGEYLASVALRCGETEAAAVSDANDSINTANGVDRADKATDAANRTRFYPLPSTPLPFSRRNSRANVLGSSASVQLPPQPPHRYTASAPSSLLIPTPKSQTPSLPRAPSSQFSFPSTPTGSGVDFNSNAKRLQSSDLSSPHELSAPNDLMATLHDALIAQLLEAPSVSAVQTVRSQQGDGGRFSSGNVHLRGLSGFFARYHVKLLYCRSPPVPWVGNNSASTSQQQINEDKHRQMRLQQEYDDDMEELRSNSNIQRCIRSGVWHAVTTKQPGADDSASQQQQLITSLYFPILATLPSDSEEVNEPMGEPATPVVVGVVRLVLRSQHQTEAFSKASEGSSRSLFNAVESVLTSKVAQHLPNQRGSSTFATQLLEVCQVLGMEDNLDQSQLVSLCAIISQVLLNVLATGALSGSAKQENFAHSVRGNFSPSPAAFTDRSSSSLFSPASERKPPAAVYPFPTPLIRQLLSFTSAMEQRYAELSGCYGSLIAAHREQDNVNAVLQQETEEKSKVTLQQIIGQKDTDIQLLIADRKKHYDKYQQMKDKCKEVVVRVGELEKSLAEQQSANIALRNEAERTRKEKEKAAAAALARKKTEQQQHWEELLHIFHATDPGERKLAAAPKHPPAAADIDATLGVPVLNTEMDSLPSSGAAADAIS